MSQLLLRPIEFSQYKTGMERPLAKSSNKTTGSSFRRPRFRETKHRTSTTVDNKGTKILSTNIVILNALSNTWLLNIDGKAPFLLIFHIVSVPYVNVP